MSPTEQDLRDLLRQRAAVVPETLDRARSVERRIVHRRRVRTASLVAALVVVTAAALPVRDLLLPSAPVAPTGGLVASPTVVTPAPSGPAGPEGGGPPDGGTWTPPRPTPMVTGSRPTQTFDSTVEGLRITTVGPQVVPGMGTTSFTVRVTLTNTSASTWRGSVGVGLYGFPGLGFGGDLRLLYPTGYYPDGAASFPLPDAGWFELAVGQHRIEGRADPASHTIGPGRSITVSIGMLRYPAGPPETSLSGWLPVLNPQSTRPRPAFPDVTALPEIAFN